MKLDFVGGSDVRFFIRQLKLKGFCLHYFRNGSIIYLNAVLFKKNRENDNGDRNAVLSERD